VSILPRRFPRLSVLCRAKKGMISSSCPIVPSSLLLLGFALLLLGACAGASAPEPGRNPYPGYAHHVPPGTTFDMTLGRELTEAESVLGLDRARVVFLGEHHTEPRSHLFQERVLRMLIDSGRPVQVTLEMFPPEVDPVLEDWRQGRLDEKTFLARSEWYTHWGFPWGYYRPLFLLAREFNIPLHGVNASKETRRIVRKGELDDLSPEKRALVGDLAESLPPHERYVFDALNSEEHGGDIAPGSPVFQRFLRVQRLWDRLMGIRTARLAAAQSDRGVTVLLVGAGHLAHGLGANLWAAREAGLPALTVWDTVVPEEALTPDGMARVPLGIGDWVRVYLEEPDRVPLPILRGIKFAQEEDGLQVAKISAFHGSALKGLRKGDRILSFNDLAIEDEVSLRLAYETVGKKKALLEVVRDGKQVAIDITPKSNPHGEGG